MEAHVGDRIVVSNATLDRPMRRGEVVEVLGSEDATHYRVRWEDGHESIFFPGPDSHVEPAGSR